jgi:replicative DNA helicase
MATNDNGTRPPTAPDIEERLLSACMDTCEAVDTARKAGLVVDDFYRPVHRAVYARIIELHALNLPHGPLDVRHELEALTADQALLDHAGGPAYLHTLYEQRVLPSWAKGDAERLVDLADRRRIIDAAHQAVALAADLHIPLEQTRGLLAGKLQAISPSTGRDRTVDGATFCLEGPATVTAIWGDGQDVVWPSGEALMLVGPQGVGKTSLAGQLTLARIGLRAELLGLPVAQTATKVLYLACDRPQQIRRSFRRMVDEADREVLAERLVVWQGPPAADIAKQATMLCDLARQAGADTIIIDSLKDVAADLVKDETGAGYNRARQLALVEGIELIELHHQRKSGSDGRKPKALSDVYGSVWLTAGAGSVILLWGDPGDPVVELAHLKQPLEEIGPFKLLHDAQHGTTLVLHGADTLDLVKAKPGLTAADAARLIFDVEGRSPEPKEIEKARRKLEALVRKVLVHRKDGAAGGAIKQPATYWPVVRAEEP